MIRICLSYALLPSLDSFFPAKRALSMFFLPSYAINMIDITAAQILSITVTCCHGCVASFFFFFCVYVPSPWVKTAFPAHLQSVHSSTLQFMNSGRSLAHCQFVASESGYRLCFFTFLLSCSPCVLHHCLLSTLPPSLPTPLCLHGWTPPLNICTFSFVK